MQTPFFRPFGRLSIKPPSYLINPRELVFYCIYSDIPPKWLEKTRELAIEVIIWPPHSPDLNPIENIWALMKQKIHQLLYLELEHAPDTEEARQLLIKAAQETWHVIEGRVLIRLSQTMPHRVHAIIEAEGWYTKY